MQAPQVLVSAADAALLDSISFYREFVVGMRISHLFMLGLLALPFHAFAAEAAAYSPYAEPARVRAFGQNGVGLTLYTNAVCDDEYEEEIDVSGSIGNVFRSFVGDLKSSSLGMPETVGTRTMHEGKMIGAKPYFREYPLVAGQPVLAEAEIRTADIPGAVRCSRKLRLGFVPVAGADYEVGMKFNSSMCLLTIVRVDSGSTGEVPISPAPVSKCNDTSEQQPAARPLLVFLFQPEEVQYRLEGYSFTEFDSEDDAPKQAESFDADLRDASEQAGATVCAVVPSHDFHSPLYDKLHALLSERGSALPGIVEDSDGVRGALKLATDAPVGFDTAAYYCMRAAAQASAAN